MTPSIGGRRPRDLPEMMEVTRKKECLASGRDGSRSAVLLLLLVGIGMIVNAGGVDSTSKCCDGAPRKMTDRGRFLA